MGHEHTQTPVHPHRLRRARPELDGVGVLEPEVQVSTAEYAVVVAVVFAVALAALTLFAGGLAALAHQASRLFT